MEIKSEKITKICVLCFEFCDSYEAVEVLANKALKILHLKPDLSLFNEPILCSECMEAILKHSSFKLSCLNAENCIKSFSLKESNIKLDLFEVYLSKNIENKTNITETHTICRLCLELIKCSHSISMDINSKDAILLNILLRKHLPEVDVNITENPVMCTTCHKLLQDYFGFMEKALDTESPMKHCKVEINSETQNHLYEIPQFIEDNCFKLEDESDETKVEIDPELSSTRDDQVQHKVPSNSEPHFQVTYSCLTCAYESRNKVKLKKHLKLHRNGFYRQVHHCNICTFKSVDKNRCKRHYLSHKDLSEVTPYPCDLCDYKAKGKQWLKQHMVVHKDVSEITMHKCTECGYETKYKRSLGKHVLLHHKESEVQMYQCALCEFATRHKYNLRKHLHNHLTPRPKRNRSVPQAHTCTYCSYETKQKHILVRHMVVHRDDTEVVWYKCEHCVWKTKYKSSLNRHLRIMHGL